MKIKGSPDAGKTNPKRTQFKPNLRKTNPICRGGLSIVAFLPSIALAKEGAKMEASGEGGSPVTNFTCKLQMHPTRENQTEKACINGGLGVSWPFRFLAKIVSVHGRGTTNEHQ